MPPSNCCNAPMTPVVADEGTGYYECSGCKKPCDPAKPFTLEKIKKDFQKIFVHVGTLDGEDCYYVNCDAQDMEQFLVKSLKSAFSELMEAVPEKHKMKPTNLSGQMFEAAHNSFRSALLAKGREMGLGE